MSMCSFGVQKWVKVMLFIFEDVLDLVICSELWLDMDGKLNGKNV